MLGGRDLQREEHGTWLGITKQGRLAVLTNFREDEPAPPEAVSRGAIVNMFLTQDIRRDDSTEAFIQQLIRGDFLSHVGGLNLVCGKVGEPLALISNRPLRCERHTWILAEQGETVGLSNAALADESWPKVSRGERLLLKIIEKDLTQKHSKAAFIDALFEVLSDDTLPHSMLHSHHWECQVKELRRSIFIPAMSGQATEAHAQTGTAAIEGPTHSKSNSNSSFQAKGNDHVFLYGTQKQTVLLVDHHGQITFQERTLFDASGRRQRIDCERFFDFKVDDDKTLIGQNTR